jgi:hypothetical protein
MEKSRRAKVLAPLHGDRGPRDAREARATLPSGRECESRTTIYSDFAT